MKKYKVELLKTTVVDSVQVEANNEVEAVQIVADFNIDKKDFDNVRFSEVQS